MKQVQFYRNEKDGSVVVLAGAVDTNKDLTIGGQKYTLLVPDSVDAAKEKHVPALQKIDSHLVVEVGSVTHPMEEKHYIEWIALVTDDKIDIRYLKPGQAPKADFEAGDAGTVYAYCNLHGLWKADFAVQEAAPLVGGSCSPEFGGCVLQDL